MIDEVLQGLRFVRDYVVQIRKQRLLFLQQCIDVDVGIGKGRALILEYTRPTTFKDKLGWQPGRILELAPSAK